jgi:hypothetical protein
MSIAQDPHWNMIPAFGESNILYFGWLTPCEVPILKASLLMSLGQPPNFSGLNPVEDSQFLEVKYGKILNSYILSWLNLFPD